MSEYYAVGLEIAEGWGVSPNGTPVLAEEIASAIRKAVAEALRRQEHQISAALRKRGLALMTDPDCNFSVERDERLILLDTSVDYTSWKPDPTAGSTE